MSRKINIVTKAEPLFKTVELKSKPGFYTWTFKFYNGGGIPYENVCQSSKIDCHDMGFKDGKSFIKRSYFRHSFIGIN